MRTSVYLEIGQKRTFAGGIDWPGWCRRGKDEESALQSLYEYGPRYERALRSARLGFKAPRALNDLRVIERLEGTTTTDFGAPDRATAGDAGAISADELKRYEALLRACWRTFDASRKAAQGQTLRSGPRGGGRDLKKMVAHVLEAEVAYLSRLGWAFKRTQGAEVDSRLDDVRREVLEGLRASAQGALAAVGPRGGRRWSGRYFVRRSAWHMLDHAWEIEDRLA